MDAPPLFSRRFGAPGPDGTLVFLHATGLNASAYEPLLRSVGFDGEIVAFSLRGHGNTRLPIDPEGLRDWHPFADDVAASLDVLRPRRPLVLGGHSGGAVTALLTARQRRIDALLMIEPVVIPRLAVMLARSPLRRFTLGRSSLARNAARRRANFASREEVEESYRSKRFFEGWNEDAFQGYLREGVDLASEGGVVLACKPDWESACFAAQGHGFWPHLRVLRNKGLPAAILAAETGSTMAERYHARARQLGVPVTVMDGGHMLPVEDPERVAGWMRRTIGDMVRDQDGGTR